MFLHIDQYFLYYSLSISDISDSSKKVLSTITVVKHCPVS